MCVVEGYGVLVVVSLAWGCDGGSAVALGGCDDGVFAGCFCQVADCEDDDEFV